MSQFFVGIEGGATSSSAVLLDQNGNILGTILDEPPTNHWNCGIEECCNQIIRTINKVKIAAGIQDQLLAGVGLCLSGCEDEKTNECIKDTLLQKEPNCGKVVVASDTVGPLYAVSKSGGVVLIAGTGSNCLLINPDKSQARCGGWSYMIGDEGSAFWIAHRAMKYCIDDNDNYEKAPHDIAFVWNSIKEHFNVTENCHMLHHWYQAFNKPFYAKLTLKLVEGARNGDKLCQHLFYLAGEAMAKHLLAVRRAIDPALINGPIGLPIVCVGSVFKSWDLLQPGFTETLGIGGGDPPKIPRFSAVRLTVPSALGAALLAAPSINSDYSKNLEIIYSYGV